MAYRSPLFDIPGDLAKTVSGAFRFGGRSSRTEVWTYLLFGNFLAELFRGLLAFSLGEAELNGPTLSSSISTVAFLLPIPALMARRLHDIGHRGWLALCLLPCFALAALTEGAQPSLVGIDKVFDSWLASVPVMLGVLLCFALSLIPAEDGGNGYGEPVRSRRAAS